MTRPAPLTPPDCDLRGMPYMELDIARLLDSDFFAMSTGEEFKAGVALWGKSWNQVPAASLPTDDRILAHLAGVGRKEWPKVKEMALHGWIECADGRLYHPTVSEKALKAWDERQSYREEKSSDAERKAQERQSRRDMFAAIKAHGLTLPYDTKTRELRAFIAERSITVTWTAQRPTPDAGADASQNERDQSRDMSQIVRDASADVTPKRGNGNGILEEEANASFVSGDETKPEKKPARRKPVVGPPEFEAAWKAYPHVQGRSSKPDALAQWRLMPQDEQDGMLGAIARLKPNVAQAHGDKGAPCMGRWLRDGKHLNWMTGAAADAVPPEVWAQMVMLWLGGDAWPDRHGPAPDQPGTRVPREVLDRLGVVPAKVAA